MSVEHIDRAARLSHRRAGRGVRPIDHQLDDPFRQGHQPDEPLRQSQDDEEETPKSGHAHKLFYGAALSLTVS